MVFWGGARGLPEESKCHYLQEGQERGPRELPSCPEMLMEHLILAIISMHMNYKNVCRTRQREELTLDRVDTELRC